ncbi:MAG TPA: glycosyltransferase family 4 protein [Gemmatimonadales bacterium]|nr:glycosyltransferase family 4 protein [Gemmatimonadales bacterium]
MKILLLAPHPFYQARGTPIAVKTVLEFLSERGDSVDVLTYSEGTDVQIPNCRVYRIPRMPGLRNIRPGFSFKKVVCDALMVGSCLRMVRRTRYDLIHAVEESAFIASLMQALAGVPYVYDMDSSLAEQMVEAYPRLGFASPALRRMEALAVRRSTGVLAVCAALEDVALGHDPGKLVGRVEDTTLLPEGMSDGRNGPILPDGDGGPVALYVGNLETYQGIDLLLEGFRHTLRAVPKARLVIVGGRQADIAHYGNRAAALGIGQAVHFLGPRPVSLLADLLREADVLVSPRLKGLNTPMKIYSYLDSGSAVLATRLRTHTQVLDDRLAYLVDPEPAALGRGLAELMSNPELRGRLAASAKEYVQREHTPQAARRKLEAFYTTMEARVRRNHA